MNELQIFNSVELRVIGDLKVLEDFNNGGLWFSATCDNDGQFAVHCHGHGGTEGLKKLIKALERISNE